jgi:hypothetical protein
MRKVPEVKILFDPEGGEVGYEGKALPHHWKLRFRAPRCKSFHSRRRR